MKKINAFYCIKTPSEWKERALMYEKKYEKKTGKAKLKGFQFAGIVCAALLIVFGGVFTLSQNKPEQGIKPAAKSSSDVNSKLSESVSDGENVLDDQDIINAMKEDFDVLVTGTVIKSESNDGFLFSVEKCYYKDDDDAGADKDILNESDIKDILNESDIRKNYPVRSLEQIHLNFRAVNYTDEKRAALYESELKTGDRICLGFFKDQAVNEYGGIKYSDGAALLSGVGDSEYMDIQRSLAVINNVDINDKNNYDKIISLTEDYYRKYRWHSKVDWRSVEFVGYDQDTLRSVNMYTPLYYMTDENSTQMKIPIMFAYDSADGGEDIYDARICSTADDGVEIKLGDSYYRFSANFDELEELCENGVGDAKNFKFGETEIRKTTGNADGWTVILTVDLGSEGYLLDYSHRGEQLDTVLEVYMDQTDGSGETEKELGVFRYTNTDWRNICSLEE